MMKLDDLTFIKQLGKGSFGEVFLTSKQGHTQYYATKKFQKQWQMLQKLKNIFIMK